MKRTHFWLALGAIVIIGLLLRLVGVGGQGLWTDEGLTLALVHLPAADLMFRSVDPTPGLYYVIQKLILPDPQTAAMARMISVLVGIAGIAASAWLGTVASGRAAGLLLAALTAVAQPLVNFSQEARAYALLVTLITAAAAALIAYAEQGGKRRDLLIFSIASILAIYTHFVGWLWFGPALVSLTYAKRKRLVPERSADIAVLAMLAASVPEIIRLLGYAGTRHDAFNWLKQHDAIGAVREAGGVILPAGLWANPWISGSALQPFLIALVIFSLSALIVIAASRTSIRDAIRKRPVTAGVCSILLFQPLLCWLFGFAVRPIMMERTLLPGAIGFLLLLTLAADRIDVRRIGVALVLAFLGATLAASAVHEKEDWRGALAAIDRRQGDVPIILCPAFSLPALQATAREGGQSGGPLLAPFSGVMTIAEPRLAQDAAFARHYVDQRMRRIVPAYAENAQPAAQHSTLDVARTLWVIEGQCPDNSRRIMTEWIGPSRWALVWTSSQDDPGRQIRVWRVDLRPGPRDIVRLPDPGQD